MILLEILIQKNNNNCSGFSNIIWFPLKGNGAVPSTRQPVASGGTRSSQFEDPFPQLGQQLSETKISQPKAKNNQGQQQTPSKQQKPPSQTIPQEQKNPTEPVITTTQNQQKTISKPIAKPEEQQPNIEKPIQQSQQPQSPQQERREPIKKTTPNKPTPNGGNGIFKESKFRKIYRHHCFLSLRSTFAQVIFFSSRNLNKISFFCFFYLAVKFLP